MIVITEELNYNISILSSCHVVEEDHLCVVVAFDLHSFGSVAGWIHVRVDVDNFSVPLVPEKESLVVVSVHSEIG